MARDHCLAQIGIRLNVARALACDGRMARQVDCVGNNCRRRIGLRAVAARTVTASAMPREKLRPPHPLVAMPRTGCVAVMVATPSMRGSIRDVTIPTENAASSAR